MGEPANNPVASAADQLKLDRLKSILRTHSFGKMLRYTSSTASTNADALAFLQQHPEPASLNGMAILAECQTAGRGRRGRTWHSPALGNIYSSVIVIPNPGTTQPGPWLSWVPLFSALAVAECLSSHTGLSVSVKWPNDLLIGERKLGGILCEQTSIPNKTMAIVVGIGLNINATLDGFPDELRTGATSLSAEGGRSFDRVAILADLYFRLEQRLDRLLLDGPTGMIDEFTQCCSTLGHRVRVTLEEQGVVQGIAESIGPDGCLCLRVVSDTDAALAGSLLEIRSAEVVHVRR